MADMRRKAAVLRHGQRCPKTNKALCAAVSPLKDKTVNSGSVTDAQNAITKQIEMEQKQCGFTTTP
ncbi:hypothetical protein [Mesorhizobium neociceri]|uniref:Uncharacterized protein n=1 Tax=Mesorhizobium neociceri TaxID=1307853 RepID=A0A838BBK4_9HYPH|nr:hypothetical protein [Mesorhizobium neociceri]MBA1143467.1 hypothetical protein [Mesorhizobium neociceri]